MAQEQSTPCMARPTFDPERMWLAEHTARAMRGARSRGARGLGARCAEHAVFAELARRAAAQVFRTGPEIEPARSSVQWFIGPTVKNRLNRRFNLIEPINRTGRKYFEPVHIYIYIIGRQNNIIILYNHKDKVHTS